MEAIQLPTLNIPGIKSGRVGKQTRTIIPATATAAPGMRLAKGNDPEDMLKKITAHMEKPGYHVVTDDPDQETRAKYPLIAKVPDVRGARAFRTSKIRIQGRYSQ